MPKTIEYKVRPVTRYVLTRFEGDGSSGASSCLGEFDRADTAFHIGCALAENDHRHSIPAAADQEETKVVWPKHPDHENAKYGFEVQPF